MATTHRNKIICVIGMGRSGTSLLCQILDKLGVYFGERGELLAASPNNERGHWEHAGINGILEGALKANGMSWLAPNLVPNSWYEDMEPANSLERCFMDLMESVDQDRVLGFKNPRTILFLPLFEFVFRALDLKPVYLRCLRDPREVYASIQRVQSPEAAALTLRECYGIWSNYYIASQAVDALDVWFEDWFTEPGKHLGRVTWHLSGKFLPTKDYQAVLDVIDPKLRHAYADAEE